MLDPFPIRSVEELKWAINAVEPDALLVDPWVMRRVIWFDRKLTGLGFRVPHRETYTIESARLLAFVDRPELNLEPTTDLPSVVILVCRPTEDEVAEMGSPDELLQRYWRLLFHSRVHL
ncbi:MAG TPA: hypothetical protein VIY86_15350, partial [Pirellulaceae bacterium]